MKSSTGKNFSLTSLKGVPGIGCTLSLMRDPLGFTVDITRKHGDIIIVPFMGQKMVLANHPDIIRYVLIENYKNYKKNSSYIRLEPVGGLGLVTSYGDKWKRDRKAIQPMFSRDKITSYHFETANAVTEKFKRKWLEETKNGPIEINITQEMAVMTTEVIIKSVFGRDIDDEKVVLLQRAYDEIMDYLKNLRLFPKVDMRKLMCMPSYFKFRRAMRQVDDIILELSVKYRSGGAVDRSNMFCLLMEAQRNNPEHFTDKEIRDQCVTMIFAGFETTSIHLQWLWYELSDRPAVVEAVRQDIAATDSNAVKLDSTGISYSSLLNMKQLDAVYQETLRLYPPLWVTGREPLEDDHWGDIKIEKGTAIGLPQFAIQRHPKWWNNPDEFLPERFLGGEESIVDGAYFPFSLGPRKCIGQYFSDMEVKMVLAKFLPFFDVVALNKKGSKLDPSISLKLEKPLQARISRFS